MEFLSCLVLTGSLLCWSALQLPCTLLSIETERKKLIAQRSINSSLHKQIQISYVNILHSHNRKNLNNDAKALIRSFLYSKNVSVWSHTTSICTLGLKIKKKSNVRVEKNNWESGNKQSLGIVSSLIEIITDDDFQQCGCISDHYAITSIDNKQPE